MKTGFAKHSHNKKCVIIHHKRFRINYFQNPNSQIPNPQKNFPVYFEIQSTLKTIKQVL